MQDLTGTSFMILRYTFCLIIPICVIILENKKINISEILRISYARWLIFVKKPKRAKRVLLELINKYPKSYRGHKLLAQIYEKEGGMRRAIDEYVYVLETKRNDCDAYYKISVLLNELGRKEDAEEMLKKLLKNKPQFHQASIMLREHI